MQLGASNPTNQPTGMPYTVQHLTVKMTGKNADLQKSEPLFGESINQFL